MDYFAQTRLSAGVVVVRSVGDEWRFLLLRAFSHWDFPKGMVEAGESPVEAAVREVEEETTLGDLRFDWGAEFVETGPYSRGKVARYYIARTERRKVDLPTNPELGRPEHSEYRWVCAEEASRLTSPRVQPVVDWASRQIGIRSNRSEET
ncbi:MAG: NUDIX domain-containing protein [Chromatiales bacterium]|jgi:8-oxo-dGTP pyrophosphatase MutT (NUDIX family)|nr:NUDIX domain-containing protein [Chromatiales bacterium]